MEAILKFNLPEDHADFELATQGGNMYSALLEMDQWLRAQYKYMSDDEYSRDKYDAYFESRQRLREILAENNVNLEL